jgi:hypothetical protein
VQLNKIYIGTLQKPRFTSMLRFLDDGSPAADVDALFLRRKKVLAAKLADKKVSGLI